MRSVKKSEGGAAVMPVKTGGLKPALILTHSWVGGLTGSLRYLVRKAYRVCTSFLSSAASKNWRIA